MAPTRAYQRLGHLTLGHIDSHVGAKVRRRRISLDLSQAELAALVGVSVQQISKYEAGTNSMAAGRLQEVARALGVGVAYLYQGLAEGPPARQAPEQRGLMELAVCFARLPSAQRAALCVLSRALAGEPPDSGADAGALEAAEA